MSYEWEETFESWANGPGKIEQEKCDNAVSAIQKAIALNIRLSKMDISVFPQGSYRARTNIRQDSDVDICVCLNSSFFADYPPGKTNQDYFNKDGDIRFIDFKNFVEEALIKYFGTPAVKRGNKAFDIHENTYRVDADVIPAFRRRRYVSDKIDGYIKPEGIAFLTDNGALIENWPEQTYENGVNKNDVTSRRYKRVIRILKNLRNKMQEDGIVSANNLASFLIECLVWNVPSDGFNHNFYTEDTRYVLAHAFNETRKEETCKEWGEVNELKYLFRALQPWTREQAHSFLSSVWDYLGFK